MARARPSNCKENLSTRRARFTVPASCGSSRAETNSCNRLNPRCPARTNNATKSGIRSNHQSHCGVPKLIEFVEALNRPSVEAGSSWQLRPHGLRQQNLRQQQPATAHETQRKKVAVLLIFLHANGRLLQRVDIVI